MPLLSPIDIIVGVTSSVIRPTIPSSGPTVGLVALPNGLLMALLTIAVLRVGEFPLLKPLLLMNPPVPL